MSKILVVEDNDTLRQGIAQTFTEGGHDVEASADGEEALAKVGKEYYDLIVTDMKLPKCSGMEVLKAAKERNPTTKVIMMTAYGTVDSAVEAMKSGVYDYLQKPFDLEELEIKADKALEFDRLSKEVETLRLERDKRYHFDNIVGESVQMKQIFQTIQKIAPSNATVLISGETGTGKEIVAGSIHYNSPRKENTYIKVNCAALPETLLESELFGHEKGAFTGAHKQRIGRFEQANAGTLFLDEIGDMTLGTQAKILRVLQEREFERVGGVKTIKVDVRLLAASNKDLREEIEKGMFREDLYYRLNVVTIRMPPLRERREDIVPLARMFLKNFARDLKKDIEGFEPEVLRYLERHHWPGNIRELENAVERAVLMSDMSNLQITDFTPGADSAASAAASKGMKWKIPPEGIDLKEVEKGLLLEALEMTNWIQKDAAKLLGINKRVINYKVKTYGITHPKWRRQEDD